MVLIVRPIHHTCKKWGIAVIFRATKLYSLLENEWAHLRIINPEEKTKIRDYNISTNYPRNIQLIGPQAGLQIQVLPNNRSALQTPLP